MADSRSITESVQVDQGSAEMAALDLMKFIGNHELAERQDRTYWLTLYRQCIKATHRRTLEDILKKD